MPDFSQFRRNPARSTRATPARQTNATGATGFDPLTANILNAQQGMAQHQALHPQYYGQPRTRAAASTAQTPGVFAAGEQVHHIQRADGALIPVSAATGDPYLVRGKGKTTLFSPSTGEEFGADPTSRTGVSSLTRARQLAEAQKKALAAQKEEVKTSTAEAKDAAKEAEAARKLENAQAADKLLREGRPFVKSHVTGAPIVTQSDEEFAKAKAEKQAKFQQEAALKPIKGEIARIKHDLDNPDLPVVKEKDIKDAKDAMTSAAATLQASRGTQDYSPVTDKEIEEAMTDPARRPAAEAYIQAKKDAETLPKVLEQRKKLERRLFDMEGRTLDPVKYGEELKAKLPVASDDDLHEQAVSIQEQAQARAADLNENAADLKKRDEDIAAQHAAAVESYERAKQSGNPNMLGAAGDALANIEQGAEQWLSDSADRREALQAGHSELERDQEHLKMVSDELKRRRAEQKAEYVAAIDEALPGAGKRFQDLEQDINNRRDALQLKYPDPKTPEAKAAFEALDKDFKDKAGVITSEADSASKEHYKATMETRGKAFEAATAAKEQIAKERAADPNAPHGLSDLFSLDKWKKAFTLTHEDRAGADLKQYQRQKAIIAEQMKKAGLDPENDEHRTYMEDADKLDWSNAIIASDQKGGWGGRMGAEHALKGIVNMLATGKDDSTAEISRQLTDGTLLINPLLVQDDEGYAKAVEKSDAKPEAKEAALKQLPALQLQQAAAMLPALLATPKATPGESYESFASRRAEDTQHGAWFTGLSDGEKVREYFKEQKNRGNLVNVIDYLGTQAMGGIVQAGTMVAGGVGIATGWVPVLGEASSQLAGYGSKLASSMTATTRQETGAGGVLRTFGQVANMAPPLALVALSRGKLAPMLAISALQTAGSQYAQGYEEMRAKGATHEEAWKAQALPAVASGIATAVLTYGGGNKGIEALYSSAGREAAKKAIQSYWTALPKAFIREGGREFLFEELPDEIISTIIAAKASGDDPAKAVHGLIDQLPEFGGAIMLLGGAGGVKEARQELRNTSSDQPSPEDMGPAGVPAVAGGANPEDLVGAEAQIDAWKPEKTTLPNSVQDAIKASYGKDASPEQTAEVAKRAAQALVAIGQGKDPRTMSAEVRRVLGIKVNTKTGAIEPASKSVMPMVESVPDAKGNHQAVILDSAREWLAKELPDAGATIKLGYEERVAQIQKPAAKAVKKPVAKKPAAEQSAEPTEQPVHGSDVVIPEASPAVPAQAGEAEGDKQAGSSDIGSNIPTKSDQPASLPRELASAKPRYSYGQKQFTLKFENDVDRAAYIAAQDKPSKRDADYVAFAMKQTGLDEKSIRYHGTQVRAYIKSHAASGKHGDTILIPSQRNTGKAQQKPQPAKKAEVPRGTVEQVKPKAEPKSAAPDRETTRLNLAGGALLEYAETETHKVVHPGMKGDPRSAEEKQRSNAARGALLDKIRDYNGKIPMDMGTGGTTFAWQDGTVVLNPTLIIETAARDATSPDHARRMVNALFRHEVIHDLVVSKVPAAQVKEIWDALKPSTRAAVLKAYSARLLAAGFKKESLSSFQSGHEYLRAMVEAALDGQTSEMILGEGLGDKWRALLDTVLKILKDIRRQFSQVKAKDVRERLIADVDAIVKDVSEGIRNLEKSIIPAGPPSNEASSGDASTSGTSPAKPVKGSTETVAPTAEDSSLTNAKESSETSATPAQDAGDSALGDAFKGLFAPAQPAATSYAEDLPADRMEGMMKAARVLVDLKLTTPQELAARFDKMDPSGNVRRYSAAFWKLLQAFNGKLANVSDWSAIYESVPKTQETANNGTDTTVQPSAKWSMEEAQSLLKQRKATPVEGLQMEYGPTGPGGRYQVKLYATGDKFFPTAVYGDTTGIANREGPDGAIDRIWPELLAYLNKFAPNQTSGNEVQKSSTQLTLSRKDAAPILAFGESIPKDELYDSVDPEWSDGALETDPHVTVLYGLTKHEADPVAAAIADHGPVTVTLGKMSLFESEDYDVLKVDVESPKLRALNAKISKLPNENTFPDYKPHMTIAYLKKGEGKKYVGNDQFEGKKITFDTMTFSPPSELRGELGKPELPLTETSAKAQDEATIIANALNAHFGAKIEVTKILPGLFKAGNLLYGLYNVSKLTDQQVLNGIPVGKDQMLVKEEDDAAEPANAAEEGPPPEAKSIPERGDTVTWTDGAGKPAVAMVDKITTRDGKPYAWLEWFGTKEVPLEQLTIKTKSGARISREKREAEASDIPVKEVTAPAKTKEKKPVDTSALRGMKTYLLDKLDEAIAAAPDEAKLGDVRKDLVQLMGLSDKSTTPSVNQAMVELRKKYGLDAEAKKADIDAAVRASVPSENKVVIEIPGDGTFTLWNDKKTLKEFAKKAKSFPTTTPRADTPTLSAIRPSGIPALKTGKTSKADLVKVAGAFASTDETRQAIMQVADFGDTLVATSGKVLFKAPFAGEGTETDPVLYTASGGKIGPQSEHEEKLGKYPNWQQVVPKDLPTIHTGLDTGRLWQVLKQASAVFKDTNFTVKNGKGQTEDQTPYVLISINPDGSLAVRGEAENETRNASNIDTYEHNVQPGSEPIGRFDADLLMPVLAGFRALGQEKVSIQSGEDRGTGAMVLSSPVAEVVIMRVGGPSPSERAASQPKPERASEVKAAEEPTVEDDPSPQEDTIQPPPAANTDKGLYADVSRFFASMNSDYKRSQAIAALKSGEITPEQIEYLANVVEGVAKVKGGTARDVAPDLIARLRAFGKPAAAPDNATINALADEIADKIYKQGQNGNDAALMRQKAQLGALIDPDVRLGDQQDIGQNYAYMRQGGMTADEFAKWHRTLRAQFSNLRDVEPTFVPTPIVEPAKKPRLIKESELKPEAPVPTAEKPVRKPRAPKKPKLSDLLTAYFTPGKVVKSYGGFDRVISLDASNPDQWSVRVQEVKQTSGAKLNPTTATQEQINAASWEDADSSQPRNHHTLPSQKDLDAAWENRPTPEPVPEVPSGIADFGEKLGGARKDKAATVDQELTDDEIAGKTLSEIWPKSEIASIEDDELASYATSLRSVIPTKPQKGYKLNAWVGKVKVVKELMRFAAEKGVPEMLTMMRGPQFNLGALADKVVLLQGIPREQWDRVGEVMNRPNAYRFEGDKKIPSPYAAVYVDGKSVQADNLDSLVEAVTAKVSEGKTPTKMQFEVRGRTTSGDNVGTWRIVKKGDVLRRSLKSFPDTNAKEALEYVKNNHTDLVAAWEDVKKRDNVKETDLRSDTNRARTAEDWRKGKDATPEMFQEAFGFRGVEFGNWVSQGANAKERQGMMNEAYDALHDLASILNIPTKALSLNGQIGLGFGSRGQGWASAHYEPGNLVINLTKTRGAGSLAHELFHAFDHYFGRFRGVSIKNNAGVYITNEPETRYVNEKTGHSLSVERWNEIKNGRGRINNEADWKIQEGIRPEVEEAFTALVKALDASPMAKRASLNDKGKSDYWGSTIERAARSFENYVIFKMQQKGYQNDYLANVVKVEDFVRDPGRYPYLLDEEIEPVAKAFDDLFSTIKTREDDNGNVALYSPPVDPMTRAEAGTTIRQFEQQWPELATYLDDTKSKGQRKAALNAIMDRYAGDAGARALFDQFAAVANDSILADDAERIRAAQELLPHLQEVSLKAPPQTPQDAEYMAAVESGDVAKQQAMVDAAAKAAGHRFKLFRGDDAAFNEFNPYKRSDNFTSAIGFSFSDDPETAAVYGKVRQFFIKGKTWTVDYLDGLYGKTPETAEDWQKSYDEEALAEFIGADQIDTNDSDTIDEFWRDKGANIIRVTNIADNDLTGGGDKLATLFIVKSPNQIKSADPITRDAEGKVIPLSQRFNPESNSILYAPAQPNAGVSRVAAEAADNLTKPGTTPAGLQKLFTTGGTTQPIGKGQGAGALFTTKAAPGFKTKDLHAAYQRAIRSTSTAYTSIRSVFEEAKKSNPSLRVSDFMAQLKADYYTGLVGIEPSEQAASTTAAGQFTMRDSLGVVHTNMVFMPTTEAEMIEAAERDERTPADIMQDLASSPDTLRATPTAPIDPAVANQGSTPGNREAFSQQRGRYIAEDLEQADFDEIRTRMESEVDADEQGHLDNILYKVENGGELTLEEEVGRRILANRLRTRGTLEDDANLIQLATRLWAQDITAATETARKLAMRVDQFESPQDRLNAAIGRIIAPNLAKLRERTLNVWTPSAKRREIARLRGEIASAETNLSRERLERKLAEAQARLDREEEIQKQAAENEKKVEKVLARLGLNASDLHLMPEDRRSMQVAVMDMPHVRRHIDAQTTEVQKAIEMSVRGYSDDAIARDTGLPLGKVERVTEDFRTNVAKQAISQTIRTEKQTFGGLIEAGKNLIKWILRAPPQPLGHMVNAGVPNAASIQNQVLRILNAAIPTRRQRNRRTLHAVKVNGSNGQKITVFVPYDPTDWKQVYRVARELSTRNATAIDKGYEYWINGILSGLQTHVVNTASNLLSTAWHYGPQWAASATVNTFVRDPKSTQWGEFPRLLGGFLKGIKPAMDNFALAWSTEADPVEYQYLDKPVSAVFQGGQLDKIGGRGPAIGGGIGRVVRVPGRFLVAADAFAKTLIMHGESAAHAYRLGKNKGLAGAALENYIASQIATYGSDSWAHALETATELTFQDENDITKDVEKVINAAKQMKVVGLLFKFLFPFVRTPTNIYRQGIRKAGGSAGMLLWRLGQAGFYKMKDGTPFFESYSKAKMVKDISESVMAGILWMAVMALSEGDEDDEDKTLTLTGARPYGVANAGERASQYRQDGGPNLIILRRNPVTGRKIDEPLRIPYGRYEPLALTVGSIVDAAREYKQWTRNEPGSQGADKLAGTIMQHLAAGAQDKTFLQGVSSLAQLAEDVTTNRLEPGQALAKQAINGAVPNLVRQVLSKTKELLPDSKKANAVLGSTTLGAALSDTEPKINEAGKPATRTSGKITSALLPVATAPSKELFDSFLKDWNNRNPSAAWNPDPLTKGDWFIYDPKQGSKKGKMPLTAAKAVTRFESMVGTNFSHKAAAELMKLGYRPGVKPTAAQMEAVKDARTAAIKTVRAMPPSVFFTK